MEYVVCMYVVLFFYWILVNILHTMYSWVAPVTRHQGSVYPLASMDELALNLMSKIQSSGPLHPYAQIFNITIRTEYFSAIHLIKIIFSKA